MTPAGPERFGVIARFCDEWLLWPGPFVADMDTEGLQSLLGPRPSPHPGLIGCSRVLRAAARAVVSGVGAGGPVVLWGVPWCWVGGWWAGGSVGGAVVPGAGTMTARKRASCRARAVPDMLTGAGPPASYCSPVPPRPPRLRNPS